MNRILAFSSALMLLALSAGAEAPHDNVDGDARLGGEPPPGVIPPPPPPGEGPRNRDNDRDKGDRGKGERGDWRGGMGTGAGGGIPGFGRPPGGGRNDGFDKLPDGEKKRVRAALDKVWTRPEVIEARDQAMKANEDFRDAVRNALQAIDPEVVTIMDRARPPEHFDWRQLPKLPPAESNDFPKVALQRMGMELWGYARIDRREETKKVHERIVASPEIQTAVSRVQTTQGEARIVAMQDLRTLYRQEVNKEFKNAKERRGQAGERAMDKDGDRKDNDRDADRKPGDGERRGPPPSL